MTHIVSQQYQNVSGSKGFVGTVSINDLCLKNRWEHLFIVTIVTELCGRFSNGIKIYYNKLTLADIIN